MMPSAMIKRCAAAGALVALSACAHGSQTGHVAGIPTWDHPLDVRNCRKVATVSAPVSASGGFGPAVDAMRVATAASGGSDLLLRRNGRDWAAVSGEAWDCAGRTARPAPWRSRAPSRVTKG